ncbi:MAG: type 1 glutamine amidotransferase domain-containing protein [Paracoccaceae bacterium]
MAKRILMVMTSHDRLGDTGEKTGLWIEEFAAPYYVFRDAGAEVTLASPAGGPVPIDPKSEAEDFQTEATRRYAGDADAQAALASTRPLSEMEAGAFDAVFYPGGHGPLWDLVSDTASIRLIEAFWTAGKPVAAVCHAPIVLMEVKDAEGRPLVAGRQVTGFANSEEALVGLTDVVPHLVEDVLRAKGGDYAKGEDMAPFTRRDGLLITGQNPASSEPAAHQLLDALG